MQIFVKNVMKPNTYCLEVKSEMLVIDFKHLLYEKTYIKPFHQLLLFAGKKLQDNKTIEEYNIQKASTIFLVNRTDGGKFENK